jgi:FkbM family methyltransferase
MLARQPEIGRRWGVLDGRPKRAARVPGVELLKRAVVHLARLVGVVIIRATTMQEIKLRASQDSHALRALQRLLRISRDWNVSSVVDFVALSRSQLSQDLWVLSVLGAPRSGFFVEFGATNGLDLSNTYLLEKHFGWRGILAEPAMNWQSDLARNRGCIIDQRCVWSQSGKNLMFNETTIGELSTIDQFSHSDGHSVRRQAGKLYAVETVSLLELLESHSAPNVIDYLSVDTEGSEYEILSHFDFSKYTFRLITVEHNHTTMRSEIFDLLTAQGYRRVLEDISDFDDWYVHKSLKSRKSPSS